MTMRFTLLCAFTALTCGCSNQSDDETDSTAPAMTTTEEPSAPGLPRSAAAEGASVFFITPEDGATLSNPVRIEFGVTRMDIVKAGTQQAHSGHHHLLIDTDLPDLGLPIPADEHHVHFGDASTSTEITLEPGPHKLQLLLGDYLHIPHEPPLVSAQITVMIE